MAFTMNVYTDNAAFGEEPGFELARILRNLADFAEDGGSEWRKNVLDVNGNSVGVAELDDS